MRWIPSIAWALLAAVLLTLAAQRNTPLRNLRQQYGISQADPLVNAPPLVTFTTVALGGFRGILADLLWLRAARLQQEGQYFELVQLADWITKLEPRFTSVWAYHGWNLAYNISVLFDAPEDRWRWVRHGISLLRDEGLKYNPGEPRLLFELGWMFQHKIAASIDQAHAYYKQAWAAEMADLFDGPRPDYGALTLAAPTREELLRRPGVADLVRQLEAQGRDPFSPARLTEARTSALEPLLHTAAGQQLVDHLRLRRMKDQYRLDPALMREVEATYGPLDWRLPQAHAVYWAWQSRLVAHGFDALAADRMIFQSLVDAFRQGSLFTGDRDDRFVPSPNPDLLPRVRQAFAEAMRRHPDQPSIGEAYVNFLGEAVVTLVSFNRLEEARAVFDEIRTRQPSELTAEGFGPFVLKRFAAVQGQLDRAQAQAVIEGSLLQALTWQAGGDPARAAGFDRLARLAWESYMAPLQGQADLLERSGLPPLEELRALARLRFSEHTGGFR